MQLAGLGMIDDVSSAVCTEAVDENVQCILTCRFNVQLAGRGVIDNVFSLCFGSVEGDGALMLGDVDLSEQDIELRYTALLSSAAHPHYYSVELESLWGGDVQLPVRPVCPTCSVLSRPHPSNPQS